MQNFETKLLQTSTLYSLMFIFAIQHVCTCLLVMETIKEREQQQKLHKDNNKKVYEKPLQPLVLPLNMFTVIELRPHFLMKHCPLPWDCSGKEWVHDPLHDMGTHTWDWGAISGFTQE